MGEDSSVSVKWDHHQPVLLQAIKEIYSKEIFADVRLECDGHEHWVHKFILSACSEYFQDVLVDVPHRGSITVSSYVQHRHLVSLLDFMYLGEVIVPQEELAELVNAAEVLMVRGFAVPCEEADDDDENNDDEFPGKNIFSKFPDKSGNQGSENYVGSFTNAGGSSYMYDNKFNFKRRVCDEEDGNKDFKDRRMFGPGSDMNIKEEPDDSDFTERHQFSSNQGNRYPNNYPMHGMDMDGNNGNQGMIQRQGPDMNGGNPNADISNLLNVLIDSPTTKGPNPSGRKRGGGANHGNLPQSQMCGAEGEPGFVCPQCRKTFHWRSNLTKHMRTHTGEKPYSCTTCSYKTSYSEALKRHVRIHTGEKPYKCDLCDYKGKDYGSLKSHLKKHAPHHLVPHISTQVSVPQLLSQQLSPIKMSSQQNDSQLGHTPQHNSTQLIHPQQDSSQQVHPPQHNSPQLVHPPQHDSPQLVHPPQHDSPQLVHPSQHDSPQLLHSTLHDSSQLAPPPRHNPPQLAPPRHNPPQLAPGLRHNPPQLAPPSRHNPAQLAQPSRHNPSQILPPSRHDPTQAPPLHLSIEQRLS